MSAVPGREAVFVFGAGASADFGIPGMDQFGHTVMRFDDTSLDLDARRDFLTVRCWLEQPRAPEIKWFDPHNTEHVFCLWEMEREIGKRSPQTLRSLTKVISYVIESSYCWPEWRPPHNLRVPEDKGYVRLLSMLWRLYRREWIRNEPPFSFVTLNYDLALEDAWLSELMYRELSELRTLYCDDWYDSAYRMLEPEKLNEVRKIMDSDGSAPPLVLARYGLLCRQDEALKRYPLLLKLHGSINWGICPSCQNVQVFTFGQDWRRPGPRVLTSLQNTECQWHPETQVPAPNKRHEFCYEPLMVPPNIAKTNQCATLRDIWRQAADMIGSAQRLIFVGYSLPESDMHLKYLLAAGLAGRELPRIMVVKWDERKKDERAAKKRYEEALGIKFDDEECHAYCNKKFSEAVDDIAEFLQRPV